MADRYAMPSSSLSLILSIYLHPPLLRSPRSPYHLPDDDPSNSEHASPNCSCTRLPRHWRLFRRLVRGLRFTTCGSPRPCPRTKRRFLRREPFWPIRNARVDSDLLDYRNTGVADIDYRPTCLKSSITGVWKSASASSASNLT